MEICWYELTISENKIERWAQRNDWPCSAKKKQFFSYSGVPKETPEVEIPGLFSPRSVTNRRPSFKAHA